MADTGTQPYSAARVDYLARYLQSQLPGLDYNLAVKWINAERGVNGNVLGVTYDSSSAPGYQGKLRTYSSQEEGIRAAAALIKSSPNYAGVRASLGKDYTTQARALVASPWNVRNSPYYARLFGVAAGSGGSTLSPNVSGPTVSEIAAPNVGTLADFQARLRELGIPAEPTHVITPAEAAKIADKLYGVRGDVATSIASKYAGRTVADAWQFNITNPSTPNLVPDFFNNPLVDSARVAGDVGAFLFDVENWQYLAALAVGVPLAIFGFYLLAGVQTGGQNA